MWSWRCHDGPSDVVARVVGTDHSFAVAPLITNGDWSPIAEREQDFLPALEPSKIKDTNSYNDEMEREHEGPLAGA